MPTSAGLTSAGWEDRALRAAASILEGSHVPFAPATETAVIRLMAVAWLHGATVGAERTLAHADAAIADLQVRL